MPQTKLELTNYQQTLNVSYNMSMNNRVVEKEPVRNQNVKQKDKNGLILIVKHSVKMFDAQQISLAETLSTGQPEMSIFHLIGSTVNWLRKAKSSTNKIVSLN